MDDLQAAVTLATSLKPAVNLAQTLLDLIGSGKGKREAVELYGQIYTAHQNALTAQAAQSALLKEKQELEQKLMRFEDWDSEKQRYHLQPIDQRAFAYIHKPGMEKGEAPHWLCQPCFENRRKRVLQFVGVLSGIGGMGMQAIWTCNECSGRVSVYFQRKPDDPWHSGAPNPPEPPPAGIKSDYDPLGPDAH